MKGKYLLLHGGVIKTQKNKTIAILATHYSGKTTTVLNCIANSNCKYLTEDLIVIDRNTFNIIPINKPAGIRHKTLNKIEGLNNRIEEEKNKRVYYSNVTGKIFVTKISNLYKESFHEEPSFLEGLVILNNKPLVETPTFTLLNDMVAIKALLPHRFNGGAELSSDLREITNLSRICNIWNIEYNLESEKHRDEVRYFIENRV